MKLKNKAILLLMVLLVSTVFVSSAFAAQKKEGECCDPDADTCKGSLVCEISEIAAVDLPSHYFCQLSSKNRDTGRACWSGGDCSSSYCEDEYDSTIKEILGIDPCSNEDGSVGVCLNKNWREEGAEPAEEAAAPAPKPPPVAPAAASSSAESKFSKQLTKLVDHILSRIDKAKDDKGVDLTDQVKILKLHELDVKIVYTCEWAPSKYSLTTKKCTDLQKKIDVEYKKIDKREETDQGFSLGTCSISKVDYKVYRIKENPLVLKEGEEFTDAIYSGWPSDQWGFRFDNQKTKAVVYVDDSQPPIAFAYSTNDGEKVEKYDPPPTGTQQGAKIQEGLKKGECQIVYTPPDVEEKPEGALAFDPESVSYRRYGLGTGKYKYEIGEVMTEPPNSKGADWAFRDTANKKIIIFVDHDGIPVSRTTDGGKTVNAYTAGNYLTQGTDLKKCLNGPYEPDDRHKSGACAKAAAVRLDTSKCLAKGSEYDCRNKKKGECDTSTIEGGLCKGLPDEIVCCKEPKVAAVAFDPESVSYPYKLKTDFNSYYVSKLSKEPPNSKGAVWVFRDRSALDVLIFVDNNGNAVSWSNDGGKTVTAGSGYTRQDDLEECLAGPYEPIGKHKSEKCAKAAAAPGETLAFDPATVSFDQNFNTGKYKYKVGFSTVDNWAFRDVSNNKIIIFIDNDGIPFSRTTDGGKTVKAYDAGKYLIQGTDLKNCLNGPYDPDGKHKSGTCAKAAEESLSTLKAEALAAKKKLKEDCEKYCPYKCVESGPASYGCFDDKTDKAFDWQAARDKAEAKKKCKETCKVECRPTDTPADEPLEYECPEEAKAPSLKLGQTCYHQESRYSCGPGLYCYGDYGSTNLGASTKVSIQEGESYVSKTYEEGNLVVLGICLDEEKADNGGIRLIEPCTDADQCEEGTSCNLPFKFGTYQEYGGACLDPQPEGGMCDNDPDCESPTTCNWGIPYEDYAPSCQPPQEDGKPCSDNSNCINNCVSKTKKVFYKSLKWITETDSPRVGVCGKFGTSKEDTLYIKSVDHNVDDTTGDLTLTITGTREFTTTDFDFKKNKEGYWVIILKNAGFFDSSAKINMGSTDKFSYVIRSSFPEAFGFVYSDPSAAIGVYKLDYITEGGSGEAIKYNLETPRYEIDPSDKTKLILTFKRPKIPSDKEKPVEITRYTPLGTEGYRVDEMSIYASGFGIKVSEPEEMKSWGGKYRGWKFVISAFVDGEQKDVNVAEKLDMKPEFTLASNPISNVEIAQNRLFVTNTVEFRFYAKEDDSILGLFKPGVSVVDFEPADTRAEELIGSKIIVTFGTEADKKQIKVDELLEKAVNKLKTELPDDKFPMTIEDIGDE
ncbi:hypothetical protein ACFL0W_04720 [Nanoarchaeota archaeon]